MNHEAMAQAVMAKHKCDCEVCFHNHCICPATASSLVMEIVEQTQRAERLQAQVEILNFGLNKANAENVHLKEVLAGKPVLQTAWEQLIDERDRLEAEVERLSRISKGEAISYFLEQGYVVLTQERYDHLQAEIERLEQRLEEVSIELIVAENQNVKAISLCRCGDGFSLTDPGTCGNCLATYYQDRVITGTVMATLGRPAPPRFSSLSRAVAPKTEAPETEPPSQEDRA